VKKVETEQSDRIIIQDDNGKQVAEMEVGEKDYLGKEKRFHKERDYSYFNLDNDEKANGIFEFLASNTTVECGQIKYIKDKNYVSISYKSTDREKAIPDLLHDLVSGKYYLREITHSHPKTWDKTLEKYVIYGPGKNDKELVKWTK